MLRGETARQTPRFKYHLYSIEMIEKKIAHLWRAMMTLLIITETASDVQTFCVCFFHLYGMNGAEQNF